MTFAFRRIDLQFSTAEGQVVRLAGLRCAAIIEAPGGYIPYASLQMRVWGMTLEHMNQFSSTGDVCPLLDVASPDEADVGGAAGRTTLISWNFS